MRYIDVAGMRVSVIGLGTWQFGSREWGYGRDYAESEAGRIVNRALDLGINLIDTAEIYAFGRSERIVGQAIAGRREEAFVATKLLPVLPLPAVVVDRARRSRQRLGVDAIDLYQVHWPNPVVPDRLAAEGLRRLLDEGVVRNVGVSNYPLARWQAFEAALGRPVVSNQVSYSLVARAPDRDIVPWAQANDRLVIAYSPLAQGFLSAKYDPANLPGGVRAANPLFLPDNLARAAELFEALRTVAKNHDATPAQVALAWVVRRPNVVAIPGAASVEQLERNAEAADLAAAITPDEDAMLTDASDRFRPRRGPAVLPDLARARLSGLRRRSTTPR
jgi:aryl-alcohol dehydrogenase-like predicted oxidoreductase